MPYRGKTVYVVGGSTGIGLAAAEAFAARAAHVLVFARRAGLLDRAVESIRERRVAGEQRVERRILDATDPERVAPVLREAVASFGPPHLLLNCVGRARPDYFENISYPQFEETLRVNLHAAWNTIQALLPDLKQTRGTIVNTASLAGLIGVFGYTDYAASKFGLVGFSEALRSELKRFGIRVCVLCPPDTDTPGFVAENRTKPRETQAVSSTARLLSAAAVAEALLAGLERNRFLIVPGTAGKLAVLARRLAPGLVERAMERALRRVARGG